MMSCQTFSFSDCNKKTYGVNYESLNLGDVPVSGMLCSLKPGTRSEIHNHVEVEFFYFVSGEGVVIIDGVETLISSGQGVRIPAYSNHIVENRSQINDLEFISFYWQSPSHKPENASNTSRRTLIFSTPPTPNGDLHLGHLSGPYLAADIYHRFINGSGGEAYHATGRDDHQTYILAKALKDKKEPFAIADFFSKEIKTTLEAYGININYFIEPYQDSDYTKFVQDIFKKLYDMGLIVEKDEPAAFSSDGASYLNEAFIRGTCPHCHSESDGNACEECGRPNQCVDLIDSCESSTKLPTSVKTCKRLYFRLSHCKQLLFDYVKATPMSAHALAVSLKMIEEGLPDICVSHPSHWGIKVPVDAYQNQTIYVWFEMAGAYLWAAKNLAPDPISNDIEKIQWFYTTENAQVVHFYGFDNTFYHTLFFPAIYLALGGINPPAAHVVNELLDLEGKKFSTSRGHLISGRQLLGKAPIDYIRWFLCRVRPEGYRSNFVLTNFVSAINHFFSGTLQEWTNQLSACVSKYFQNSLPEPGAWTFEQRRFYNLILAYRNEVLASFEPRYFSPRIITKTLQTLAETALDFLKSELIFINNEVVFNNLRTTVALSSFALKIFSLLSKPIMPSLARDLLVYLNVSENTPIDNLEFIASNTQCQPSKLPNFEKLPEVAFESLRL